MYKDTRIVIEDMKYITENYSDFNIFENKTVLISGANGMLPFYIARFLLYINDNHLKSKCKIIGLVRNYEKAMLKFNDFVSRDDIKIIEHDISNSEFNIDEQIDYIIHAASQASPIYYSVDPVGTLTANVFGTANLLNLAKEKKVKSFLFFSSGEVYGKHNNLLSRISEDDYGIVNPVELRSCYAESKRMGENMCVAWNKQYNIPTKIARIFHTFGPGILKNDGRVFADFTYNIVNSKDFILNSDGKANRSFCYITDTTIALLTILISGINGEAYNVGNPENEISIVELAKMLIDAYPEKKLNLILNISTNQDYLKSKIEKTNPNIQKLEKLGFKPKVSIKESFIRTINHIIMEDFYKVV